MSSPRLVGEKLLDEARRILQKKFSDDLNISSLELLCGPPRRNIIVRLHLEGSSDSIPKSVILKQSLAQGDDDAANKRAFSRFARDWAGLAFANSIPQSTHNTPHFYDSSNESRFILIEDLGQAHVSLVDTLTRDDPIKAHAALVRYVTALASFHAASYKHTQNYLEILRAIDPSAEMPMGELNHASKDLKERLSSTLRNSKLDLPLTKDFLNEVDQILDGIFIPGLFTVLTHGDTAPDNMFDHANGLQLIDFEMCAPRNALFDATFLRMSIPTGWCAKTIPEENLMHLEKIYRDELAKGIPDVKYDNKYYEAYVQACGFHALQQMANVIDCLETNKTWSPPGAKMPLPEGSLWDEGNNYLRPRCITRLQTFIEQAEKHDMYPQTRKMASNMLNKLKELWPDAKPLDSYPAFKQVKLENVSTKRHSTPTPRGY